MESINNGGLNTVELKRDIYKRLLEWKRENTHKVLELEDLYSGQVRKRKL